MDLMWRGDDAELCACKVYAAFWPVELLASRADSMPHRREDLEDMGRCQGREAALQVQCVLMKFCAAAVGKAERTLNGWHWQEWKRRWLATVRALFQDSDCAHKLLLQRLAQFS